jgi:hypothetical protein
MSRQEKLAALASTGVTKAELDNIDGGTARGTTAIADGDGVLINDAGTMRMTSVETMATYIGTKVGGGMEFIASSGAISNAASVVFTAFDSSKYDHYQFWLQYCKPATDAANFFMQTSTDGGSNYASTSGDYHNQETTDQIGHMLNGNTLGNDTNEYGISSIVTLFAPHLSTYTFVNSDGVTQYTNGAIYHTQAGSNYASSVRLAAEDVDAVKFIMSSGNITSGEITMFGIVNS